MNCWLLKRKVHTSWLIATCCAGIFIGVFLAQYIHNSHLASTVVLIMAIILISLSLWRRYTYLIPLLIIGGILIGLWRGSISQNELAQFNPLYGKTIYVTGIVKDDVDTSSSNQLVVRLDKLNISGKDLSGVLWITTTGQDIKRGDKLILHGKLIKGFGNFSGVIYRATID